MLSAACCGQYALCSVPLFSVLGSPVLCPPLRQTEYNRRVDLTLTNAWSIELAGAAPPARLAAEELRRTLQRIGGPALPIVAHAAGPRIALCHGAHGDGFVRAADAAGLLLRGDGPRGLLYAAYDLLAALGCRWLAPGADGENIPRYDRVTLPAETIADRPALPGRSLIIGHDIFLAEGEAWIIWAARNRLNTIFIHTIAEGLPLGACRLTYWQRRRRDLLPLIAARGMDLELGGHHLRDLLPRRLFRRDPELFRSDGARRTPDANCCPSNPATQARLRNAMQAFVRRNPEAAVYHLWPDDLLGGGWCACSRCAGLTPADQALLATNQLAAALAELRPEARISTLAYHDTEAPPAQVTPLPNVDLLFAPRPRSYAFGIDGAPNAGYAARLANNLAPFRERAAARPAVFEYYLDGILFKSAPPPLAATLAADLRSYQAAGVHTVHALLTGDRPFRSAPLNAWLFAQLAWHPEQDPAALLATYAAARAPRTPAALVDAYNALAAAWLPALDHDSAAELAARVERSRDPVGNPPRDVLDLMAVLPAPANELTLERLHGVAGYLAAGRAAWQTVIDSAFVDAARLETEQAEWELGAQTLEFFTARQQLAVLVARGAPRRQLRPALREAQTALDRLAAWAVLHVPSGALANHRLMRLIFQLQLDAIDDQSIALPWRRLGLRVVRALTIGRLLAAIRMRR